MLIDRALAPEVFFYALRFTARRPSAERKNPSPIVSARLKVVPFQKIAQRLRGSAVNDSAEPALLLDLQPANIFNP